jgi:hypothetical protein
MRAHEEDRAAAVMAVSDDGVSTIIALAIN